MLAKLKAIWTQSWTKLLAEVKIIGGLFLALGAYAGGVVNDPGVHTAIGNLNLPAEIGLGLAVLGALVLVSMPHSDA